MCPRDFVHVPGPGGPPEPGHLRAGAAHWLPQGAQPSPGTGWDGWEVAGQSPRTRKQRGHWRPPRPGVGVGSGPREVRF